jgi:hypothetical protein
MTTVHGRATAAVGACVLMAALLAGCTTARSNLGTSDSSCYLALPTATKAVHSHGRLLGVHRFTLSALHQQAPHLREQLAMDLPASESVCVVAFEGDFTSGSVSEPHGRDAGRLAVVVSTTPGNHVLGTVIFARAPLHFGHFH